MGDATFYTVGNSRYFPGTAALINSMRLTGNEGRIVVLDAGLSTSEQARISAHAGLVDARPAAERNPLLLKVAAASLEPPGTIVFIDSDIAVTGSLAQVLRRAANGSICVYPDGTPERWFSEWQELFRLAAPLRREVYVNSGFVVFSTDAWPQLLRRWHDAAALVPTERTRAGGAPRTDPLWDGDQDALNAILMSEVPPGAVELLPVTEGPHEYSARRRVAIRDYERLDCELDGVRTLLIHSAGEPKPWVRAAWGTATWRDGYAALLPRLLLAPDVEVRLSRHELPIWLRPGRRSRAAARALDAVRAAAREMRDGVRRLLRTARTPRRGPS
jgi:hypothetical protein